MGMKLSGLRAFKKRLDAVTSVVNDAVSEALQYGGKYAVKGIRDGSMSNWIDHTGNLRSSVGYTVLQKGRTVVMSGFEKVGGTVAAGVGSARNSAKKQVQASSENGSETGKALADKLAQDYARYDHALIIVAGMSYAVYVEAIKNKVVLEDARLWLEGNIRSIVQARIDAALKRFG